MDKLDRLYNKIADGLAKMTIKPLPRLFAGGGGLSICCVQSNPQELVVWASHYNINKRILCWEALTNNSCGVISVNRCHEQT